MLELENQSKRKCSKQDNLELQHVAAVITDLDTEVFDVWGIWPTAAQVLLVPHDINCHARCSGVFWSNNVPIIFRIGAPRSLRCQNRLKGKTKYIKSEFQSLTFCSGCLVRGNRNTVHHPSPSRCSLWPRTLLYFHHPLDDNQCPHIAPSPLAISNDRSPPKSKKGLARIKPTK